MNDPKAEPQFVGCTGAILKPFMNTRRDYGPQGLRPAGLRRAGREDDRHVRSAHFPGPQNKKDPKVMSPRPDKDSETCSECGIYHGHASWCSRS
jgi:hypothetical protein